MKKQLSLLFLFSAIKLCSSAIVVDQEKNINICSKDIFVNYLHQKIMQVIEEDISVMARLDALGNFLNLMVYPTCACCGYNQKTLSEMVKYHESCMLQFLKDMKDEDAAIKKPFNNIYTQTSTAYRQASNEIIEIIAQHKDKNFEEQANAVANYLEKELIALIKENTASFCQKIAIEKFNEQLNKILHFPSEPLGMSEQIKKCEAILLKAIQVESSKDMSELDLFINSLMPNFYCELGSELLELIH